MPSRAELTQYQKRFLELYSQGGCERLPEAPQSQRFCPCVSVSATHKETKQFFTLYNTLDDKKVYLEKEVSDGSTALTALTRSRLFSCPQVNLLNSIHDNFQQ